MTTESMFRKPRKDAPASSVLGIAPDTLTSPRSSKRQKTSHSASSSTAKPKSKAKPKRASTKTKAVAGSAASAKAKAKAKPKDVGNQSILNFFKPKAASDVVIPGGRGVGLFLQGSQEDGDVVVGDDGDDGDEAEEGVEENEDDVMEEVPDLELKSRETSVGCDVTKEGDDVFGAVSATKLNGSATNGIPRRESNGLTMDLDPTKSSLFGNLGRKKVERKDEQREMRSDDSDSMAEEVGFEENEDAVVSASAVLDVGNRHIGEFLVKTNEEPEREIPDGKGKEAEVDDIDDEEDGDFRDEELQGMMEEEDDEYTATFDPIGDAIESGFDEEAMDRYDIERTEEQVEEEQTFCPICPANLTGLSETDANNHVNHCLDGNPIPLPTVKKPLTPPKSQPSPPKAKNKAGPSTMTVGTSTSAQASFFTKLMSTNKESQKWASAAKEEADARGKRNIERNCPFYKILFSGPITVDAFRYGAVPNAKAYFLSHFHSDHYIGLNKSWCHGPIWCSRVTANLVRSRLGVDRKWVHELPWEEWTDIPDTGGVRVRGIDANHCPGSMLFLFERVEKSKKTTRILHCGDFRADPKHLEHPLLKGQHLDACYLDTTYLNPRYAFPSQENVINACSEMCKSLSKPYNGKTGLDKFVTVNKSPTSKEPESGRLLVVVGTYSIGKERVCVGIAQALGSKIFAPTSKMRTIGCLEDPLLNSLLTSNPAEAQVHMTPLREIRAETLKDYLNTQPSFTRVIGFRPSGWNYKPPTSRALEGAGATVREILYGANWKSPYTMGSMVEGRGSNSMVKEIGVPYSEHSSFRELTMFACSLECRKWVPTVNVGSARSRERMKAWCDKWEMDKRKNGLFKLGEEGACW